jgi:protein-S-isoprenylcysteine O-methyltransferase Ste14
MKRQRYDNIVLMVLAVAFFFNMLMISARPVVREELLLAGYVLLGVGILLFALSVITLRLKGTQRVVDTGVYRIVRHPMYLGAMIMFLSHVFFGQNWMVVVGTVIALICCYLLVLSGDQRNIEKFSDDYLQYMKKVPRINFVSGIVRLVHNTQ